MSRSNKATSDDETLLVKLLIPSASAGIILGKGGETIICLQSQYCTNIKLSKAGDFFPGTMERVCVILGSQTGIRSVLDVIVDKIRDKPDSHGVPSELKVKLVVPHSTASMIIGKGGECVARIQKESSARVQVLQQHEDNSLQERIVTVQGETSAMGFALDRILEKIFSDPLSNSCPNVSYSDALVPSLAGGSSSGTASKLHTGIIPNHPSFAMLRYSLRFCGYAESSIEEIVAAVYTLASYGFLSLAEGSGDPTNIAAMLGMAAAASGNQPYPGCTSDSSSTTNYGTASGTPLPTSADYAMAAAAYANNSLNANVSYGTYQNMMTSGTDNYGQNAAYQYYGHGGYNMSDYSSSNCIPPPPPPPPVLSSTEVPNSGEAVSQSFEVGEHIVGALLGPGGRSIVDLQTWSGAAVEVSKKGTYAPGTRNRIVTVTGSAAAVQSATYFIKQCIDHEEMRRASSAAQPPALPATDMPTQSWPTPQQTAR